MLVHSWFVHVANKSKLLVLSDQSTIFHILAVSAYMAFDNIETGDLSFFPQFLTSYKVH